MRYAIIYSALIASASAHGLVTRVLGDNGVVMPGLSVADNTPRDCATNSCGSQADTAIIRDRDMETGKASPLGLTQGNGPVDPAAIVSSFMGTGEAPSNQGSNSSWGVEDDLSALARVNQRRDEYKRQLNDLFGTLMGGAANLMGNGDSVIGPLGLAGIGGKRTEWPMETIVSDMAGSGAQSGLPTCNDNGEISMVYRQINQDGAGPLTATIDPSSGGTDPNAFQTCKVTKNVPGVGYQGLSIVTNTDYPLKIQMPEGMVCVGKVGGAENVCIARVRNGAITGPFGGGAAFTQSPAARQRALAYRLKKRFELMRDEGTQDENAAAAE